MRHHLFPTLVLAGLAAALLPADRASAGGTYHAPHVTARPGPSGSPGNIRWDIPTGAPTGRTYTWYAPPAGYQVVIQATPTEPRSVTVEGPDGSTRTFRLEGPVIMRVREYVVRQGSR